MELGATVLVDGTKRAIFLGTWMGAYCKVRYTNGRRATVHKNRVTLA